MPANRPTTIDEYIEAAPGAGRAHLRRLREILASVAPEADQVIKWNQPFFVEPRFVFSFSALKAHASFAPVASAMEAFRDDFDAEGITVTKGTVKLPYDEPLPEDLLRRMAEHCLAEVSARTDSSFW